MKYLVMKEISDKYKIVKSFDNLTQAMTFAIKEGYVGTGLVVKVIENWSINEREERSR